MSISLTPELERFILAKVESGRYDSSSEVVREALHLLDERERAIAEFNLILGQRLASLNKRKRSNPASARTHAKI
jgi:antitoxin ParD1/3/4